MNDLLKKFVGSCHFYVDSIPLLLSPSNQYQRGGFGVFGTNCAIPVLWPRYSPSLPHVTLRMDCEIKSHQLVNWIYFVVMNFFPCTIPPMLPQPSTTICGGPASPAFLFNPGLRIYVHFFWVCFHHSPSVLHTALARGRSFACCCIRKAAPSCNSVIVFFCCCCSTPEQQIYPLLIESLGTMCMYDGSTVIFCGCCWSSFALMFPYTFVSFAATVRMAMKALQHRHRCSVCIFAHVYTSTDRCQLSLLPLLWLPYGMLAPGWMCARWQLAADPRACARQMHGTGEQLKKSPKVEP